MSISSQLKQSSEYIGSLPNELLGWVFRHYVSLDNSPWLLALVCRRWHQVALCTPDLWTHIVLTNHVRPVHQTWNVLEVQRLCDGRASVCMTVDELAEASRLAGILPLHVTVIREYDYGVADVPSVHLVNSLFQPALAHRVIELSISFDSLLMEHFHQLVFGPLPNLQVLRIKKMRSTWLTKFLSALHTGSTTRLRFLKLSKGGGDTFTDPIVSKFGNLEQLLGYIPQADLPHSTMSHLRELDIMCAWPSLEQLELPQLKSLRLYDRHPIPENRLPDDSYHPHLPELIKLFVASAKSIRWIEHLIAPKLQNITISGALAQFASSGDPSPAMFTEDAFPAVTRFDFESDITPQGGLSAHELILLSVLQAVPNATDITITAWFAPVHKEPKLVLWLLDHLEKSNRKRTLCPRLKNLKVVSPDVAWSRLTEDEVSVLLSKAVIQMQMGQDLRGTTVRWKDIDSARTAQCFM